VFALSAYRVWALVEVCDGSNIKFCLLKIPAILCSYVNATGILQIVRVTNISNWYFERVILTTPLFEAQD